MTYSRKVGFTGTRHGMSEKQMFEFRIIVMREQWSEFHHGDCIGADAQAHYIVRADAPRCRIVVHPMIDAGSGRAYMAGDTILVPKPALIRNHDIVDAVRWLVAAPQTAEEMMRSGTWATIRYARKTEQRLTIILP